MNANQRHDEIIRALALYVPIALAAIARLVHGRRPRQFAACLLSMLWTLPALLLIQLANVHFGWWTFTPDWPARIPLPKDFYFGWEVIHSIPIELLLGWAILWGLVPQLAFPNLSIPLTAAIMLAADLVFMPLCAPTIHLNPTWLIGEAVSLTFVLLPSLAIARWTERNMYLHLRAAFQIATATLIFLFLIPETGFYVLPHFLVSRIFLPRIPLQLVLQLIFVLAIPGLSAVFEFADRGLGTPIPYDPPQRLVTSGIYRYLANPMQLSAALVMFAWALFLRDVVLLLPGVIAIIYSAGIAEWDEGEDLAQRFGQHWRDYRDVVRNWFPRWRPYHAGPPALLYIARTCGPCSEVRNWIESRHPIGLEILDAESLPPNSIRRMRYDPADGTPTVEGVRAMGRALEHLNLFYAFAGCAMRLPILWRFLQLCLDAAGLGPRDIPGTCMPVAKP